MLFSTLDALLKLAKTTKLFPSDYSTLDIREDFKKIIFMLPSNVVEKMKILVHSEPSNR